jgi:uncharacterized repeat protein (TIGR02543 family)
VKKTIICLLLAFAAVSAQNKQRIAVLPSVGDLDPRRLILLTDKVREIATKNLPIDDFNILKQDVITKMIGEEELYRSCKEGVCIGDLAKKTNANYGARCDVVQLDDRLVLKFELYSVNEEAIFETFTDYNVKDFYGMLASLEARLPETFKKVVGVSDRARALEAAKEKAKEQQRQEYKPTPKPEPPKTHTVAATANPPDGGTVSRSPNYSAYHAGTRVTVTASPNAGYTFTGWSGVTASAGSNITITVEDNLTLTANFQRIPPPPPPKPKPKPKPHEPPSPPQELKDRRSAGTGGFFANDVGGGLEWDNGEYIAMPYSGGGVYLFYDVVYAEIFAGAYVGNGEWEGESVVVTAVGQLLTVHHSSIYMQRTYINFGAYIKYPFGAGNIKFYPLLGLDYDLSISSGLSDSRPVSPSDPSDAAFGPPEPDATDLSALWLKLGGGVDIGLWRGAYLRAELLYGWRTYNNYEKRSADESGAVTRLGNGLTLRAGIGFKL